MFNMFRRPHVTTVHIYVVHYFGIIIGHSCALTVKRSQTGPYQQVSEQFPLQTRTRLAGKGHVPNWSRRNVQWPPTIWKSPQTCRHVSLKFSEVLPSAESWSPWPPGRSCLLLDAILDGMIDDAHQVNFLEILIPRRSTSLTSYLNSIFSWGISWWYHGISQFYTHN